MPAQSEQLTFSGPLCTTGAEVCCVRLPCVFCCRLCVTTVPTPRYCPNPHWPPLLLPILAALLSILMIPCYCYSCGPMSGPYWAEERNKLMMVDEPYENQICAQRASYNCAGGYKGVAYVR